MKAILCVNCTHVSTKATEKKCYKCNCSDGLVSGDVNSLGFRPDSVEILRAKMRHDIPLTRAEMIRLMESNDEDS